MHARTYIIGAFAISALTSCGTEQDIARTTFPESTLALGEIARANRECDHLLTVLASARDAPEQVNALRPYSDLIGDLHFHIVMVNDSLEKIESMSAMTIASGWARVSEWDRLSRSTYDPDLRASRFAQVGKLHDSLVALSVSSSQFFTQVKTFKSLESQTIKELDQDLPNDGIDSTSSKLSTLITDEPLLLKSIADISSNISSLNELITTTSPRIASN
jgi:hypothetical protein